MNMEKEGSQDTQISGSVKPSGDLANENIGTHYRHSLTRAQQKQLVTHLASDPCT